MGGIIYEVSGQSKSSRLKGSSLMKELQFTFKNDKDSKSNYFNFFPRNPW